MSVFTYERELLKRARGKKGKMPLVLLSPALLIADRLRERKEKSLQEVRYDDLLLRKREEIRYGEALTLARCFLVAAAGLILTSVLLMKREDPAVNALARPGFGAVDTVSLLAKLGESEEKLSVTVSGQDPEGEALSDALDRAFEELKTSVLGDNESLDNVTSGLSFSSENDLGIRFAYVSSAPEILSDYGILMTDGLPEEGVYVEIFVTASYGGAEKEYVLPVTVKLPVEKLTLREKLERALLRADEDGKGEEVLSLPEEVDGVSVSYERKQTSPWIAFVLSLAGASLLYFLPREKEKELLKEREAELERSYPQLLSKLDTLIHAGMSIRSAWTRIVREYREGRKTGERKREYAYEEMSLTLLRLEQGENEGDAYEEFGKRCSLRSYRKLGNLLGQNLRQGISGLEGALREEMEKALEDRKNRALRAGEEAGTRLLFPMILMLGIVVVTLVVPAFLSF